MPTFLHKPSGQSSLRADINVTPLVDIVLVLLIIFMLVAPMLTRGQTVQLPAAATPDQGKLGGAAPDLVLTITADKRLWLDTRAVEPPMLIEALGQRSRGAARALLIRADASVTMRDLRPVLRELRRAGMNDVALAVLAAREGSP